MELLFRPIILWPGKLSAARRSAPFRAGYQSTLTLLDRELHALGAKTIVLQVALSESDIRLDGQPRANSRPSYPGVILSFECRHGALSYPCDTYIDWQDNLRAVALSLEHLRAVDRYGVTRRGEQYTGWAALPAPNGHMTREEAAAWMARMANINDQRAILVDGEARREVYRALAFRFHPDRSGDPELFKKLQRAKEVLEGGE